VIAVDTSALIAMIGGEPLGQRCAEVLAENHALISAANLTEVLIVGSRPEYQNAIEPLLDDLRLEVIPITEPFAQLAGAVYRRWGKGFHPARLNYGDSFSYALARMYDCPLLYIGDDFAQTDVRSALA
jgi:ribonuclease VapC